MLFCEETSAMVIFLFASASLISTDSSSQNLTDLQKRPHRLGVGGFVSYSFVPYSYSKFPICHF